MGGIKEILKQLEGMEVELAPSFDFPNPIPIEDRIARLEKLVTTLLKTDRELVTQVGEVKAATQAATSEIHSIWWRIDRIERHLLDFMKAKGGPGYWYLDPQP